MGNYDIQKPFIPPHWFSIIGLFALLPVAAAIGFIFSHLIRAETLQQDTALTARFVQSCFDLERWRAGPEGLAAISGFPETPTPLPALALPANREASGAYRGPDLLRLVPDVLLASLVAKDGRILWSTHRGLEGRQGAGKEELARAFGGEQLARHYGATESAAETARLALRPGESFVRSIIPLRDAGGEIVLVADIYREPKALLAGIRRGQALMWGIAATAGGLIFLFLVGIERASFRMLQKHQGQLREMDSLAFMGEVSSAVAHGLRNPLASIRSSAELVLYADYEPVRKNARDIVTQVDYLSKWIRELLLYTQPVTGEPERVNLAAALAAAVDSFTPACSGAGIRILGNWAEAGRTDIEGNASLVTQILHSVLSNAVEAMPRGGDVHVTLAPGDRKHLVLSVRDNGIGMSEKQLALAFKPFHTTKRHGLGVGLAMVRRGMERFGGTVALSSREGQGTEIRLEFRKWEHGQNDTGRR